MLISNDPGQTRSAGAVLSSAGAGLVGSAALANLGDGAGGDAAPRTDGALGSLSRAWRAGLTTYGRQVEALGGFADLMAAAFETVDGPRR
jgi:hypothetical protein